MNSLKERERERENSAITHLYWVKFGSPALTMKILGNCISLSLISYNTSSLLTKRSSCNSLNSMLYNSIIYPLSIRKIAFSEINWFYFFWILQTTVVWWILSTYDGMECTFILIHGLFGFFNSLGKHHHLEAVYWQMGQ